MTKSEFQSVFDQFVESVEGVFSVTEIDDNVVNLETVDGYVVKVTIEPT